MSRAAASPPSLASAIGRQPPRAAELKQRLEAWGEGVVPRLTALGLDVTECRAEGPRLVFLPDARLTLLVEEAYLEVAVELPPSEVAAVRARLVHPERALELASAIESLPEQFTMGPARPDLPRVPVTQATTDEVRALLERLEGSSQPLWLGWSVPRADALVHASILDDLLCGAAVALGAVLALLAWTPAALPPSATDHARRRRPPAEEDRRSTKRRARARSRDRDRDREADLDAEPEAQSERQPVPDAPPPPRPMLRSRLRTRAPGAVDVKAPIEPGSRVRVLEGPFAGKVGVVQDLDGEGGARVMLGLLAVRLDVKDLVVYAEGRVRPKLSSSHRKPLPVRS